MTQMRQSDLAKMSGRNRLADLFTHRKPRGEIIREYDLTALAFDKAVAKSTFRRKQKKR